MIRRGEIWWADLGTPFGSEPGYRRPVVILQTNDFNASPIATVVVVPMTSNLRLADAPGNVRCHPRQTGLSKASVINVSQIAALDKRRLIERVGRIDEKPLALAEAGIRLILGLK